MKNNINSLDGKNIWKIKFFNRQNTRNKLEVYVIEDNYPVSSEVKETTERRKVLIQEILDWKKDTELVLIPNE